MSVTQASLLGNTFGSKASGTIPVGGIIMWSGSIASIPTGWSLCNGSSGTPNLQDRFIVGAGSGYGVAATGGSANATLVSHSHTGTTNDAGSHQHSYREPAIIGNGERDNNQQFGDSFVDAITGVAGNHNHTFTTSIEGSSGTNANLPPYYALAFIMRTS